jgi:hypothetical protein
MDLRGERLAVTIGKGGIGLDDIEVRVRALGWS